MRSSKLLPGLRAGAQAAHGLFGQARPHQKGGAPQLFHGRDPAPGLWPPGGCGRCGRPRKSGPADPRRGAAALSAKAPQAADRPCKGLCGSRAADEVDPCSICYVPGAREQLEGCRARGQGQEKRKGQRKRKERPELTSPGPGCQTSLHRLAGRLAFPGGWPSPYRQGASRARSCRACTGSVPPKLLSLGPDTPPSAEVRRTGP
mmetsp:Transcript_1654/g.3965  ORF Transcript_1654/g.3965 Transcript_1654/m.3965 type:complete len:204 (+) Transcript_1654:193-804(+)